MSAPNQAPEAPFGLGPQMPDQAPESPEQTLPFGQPEGATGMPGDLPNYQKEWQSGDVGPGLSPKPTKWDKVAGGLQEGLRGSFMGTGWALYKDKSAETGSMLSPSDANKLNPYRDVPYTTPVDSGIVAMEAADGRKQQQLQEWLGRNEGGNFGRSVGRFAGAFADAPLYAAVGVLTEGVGDLALGGIEASGSKAAALAARYGWTLGEFSTVGEIQNKLESSMGSKEKPFYQVVKESLGGAAIATGIGALARNFMNRGEANPELMERGLKEHIGALGNDESLPPPPGGAGAIEERKAGVQLDPSGDRIHPTVKTAPLNETPLFGATHGDGMPLVHEHGLGDGQQFTDSRAKAENGVSRSTDTPGQIAQTKLPSDAKLLDLDVPAAADYGSKDSFIKAVEKKIGLPLDAWVKDGGSLKSIITNLGDWAGVDTKEGSFPEDVLKQVQEVAKEQGYMGYQFQDGSARQVHAFDPAASGMKLEDVTHTDPEATPPLGAPQTPSNPEERAAQERLKSQNYSPSLQEVLNKIRKTAMTLHPDNLQDQIKQVQETLGAHKELLQQISKENPELAVDLSEDMQQLREQEAHDKRMLDVAKRIMNCGATE